MPTETSQIAGAPYAYNASSGAVGGGANVIDGKNGLVLRSMLSLSDG